GDFARPRKRRVEIDRRIEIASYEPALIGRAEFEPGVAHRIARGLPEPAMARPAQQFREPHQLVDLVPRAPPVGDLVERVPHQRRATRQGVQKPQLSWAKKCAKLRATSNKSRSLQKIMKAPAVGTSSKAICRRNSSGVRQTPDGPLTCTAATSPAPQS